MNIERGVTRIYDLLWCLWALYWIGIIIGIVVDEGIAGLLAEVRIDPVEYLVLFPLLVVGPVVLRLVLKWIIRGFRD
jgi:hypothetical protein